MRLSSPLRTSSEPATQSRTRPTTWAPRSRRPRTAHAPTSPVQPVTKTRRSCQNPSVWLTTRPILGQSRVGTAHHASPVGGAHPTLGRRPQRGRLVPDLPGGLVLGPQVVEVLV